MTLMRCTFESEKMGGMDIAESEGLVISSGGGRLSGGPKAEFGDTRFEG